MGLDSVGVKTSASRLGYTLSAQDWLAFVAVDLEARADDHKLHLRAFFV
jgi:hypothetical protein